jgi:hypothetical protein
MKTAELNTSQTESRAAANVDRTNVQFKLMLGQPNDRFEQEADAVAEKVVSGETAIQRKCADCEQEDELQMKPLAQLKTNFSESGQEVKPWIQQQIDSSRGGGMPLHHDTRTFMESGIGADFGGVKIHTDSKAAQMNRELGARAFTVGNDVYFNSGQYSPETGEGKRLLAHELTHTVQQGASKNQTVQRDFALAPPNANPVMEELSESEIRDAIRYNERRFQNVEELLLIRDVLGLSHENYAIDEDLVHAVARWQAANNLDQDGKLGPNTLNPLIREYEAEDLTSEAALLRIRTRASDWRNNFQSKFNAELDHQDALLTLHVKINFNFRPAGTYPDFDGTMVPSPGWTQAQRNTWQSGFISHIQNRWSWKFGLIPSAARSNNYLDHYNVRVRLRPVTTGAHHTVNVVNVAAGTFFRSSAGVGSASLDSGDINNRNMGGGRMQRGVEHEFGHMMGLNHPGGAGSGAATYAADADSIMGSGSTVRSSNYQPFVDAIRAITGIGWKTTTRTVRRRT